MNCFGVRYLKPGEVARIDFIRILPMPKLLVEFRDLKGKFCDLIEFFGVGPLGTLHTAIELGRTRRQHKQKDTSPLAFLLKDGLKLTAINAHRRAFVAPFHAFLCVTMFLNERTLSKKAQGFCSHFFWLLLSKNRIERCFNQILVGETLRKSRPLAATFSGASCVRSPTGARRSH